MTAWLLFIQLGYPSYGYTAVPGIASEVGCKQLAKTLEAGEENGARYPIWKCIPYLTIGRR